MSAAAFAFHVRLAYELGRLRSSLFRAARATAAPALAVLVAIDRPVLVWFACATVGLTLAFMVGGAVQRSASWAFAGGVVLCVVPDLGGPFYFLFGSVLAGLVSGWFVTAARLRVFAGLLLGAACTVIFLSTTNTTALAAGLLAGVAAARLSSGPHGGR